MPGHASGYWPSVRGYCSCLAHIPELRVASVDASETSKYSFHLGRQASTPQRNSHYFYKCMKAFPALRHSTTLADKKQMTTFLLQTSPPMEQTSPFNPGSLSTLMHLLIDTDYKSKQLVLAKSKTSPAPPPKVGPSQSYSFPFLPLSRERGR